MHPLARLGTTLASAVPTGPCFVKFGLFLGMDTASGGRFPIGGCCPPAPAGTTWCNKCGGVTVAERLPCQLSIASMAN
jgi:hypothetical protein